MVPAATEIATTPSAAVLYVIPPTMTSASATGPASACTSIRIVERGCANADALIVRKATTHEDRRATKHNSSTLRQHSWRVDLLAVDAEANGLGHASAKPRRYYRHPTRHPEGLRSPLYAECCQPMNPTPSTCRLLREPRQPPGSKSLRAKCSSATQCWPARYIRRSIRDRGRQHSTRRAQSR